VAWAQNILCDTADRSSFPETPQQYGFPEDEPLGKLRLWCDDLTRKKITPVKARPKLYALALTSSLEQLSGHASQIWGDPASFRNAFSAEIQYLKHLLEGAWQPFKMEEINLHLTWRENLAFGVQGPLPDLLALEFIQAEGLDDFFTRQGLGFNVGRLGGNLSGGQGQLVAICRALLRRTPVLILDEPTSSLDPISKTNVARFLRKWKNGRIVITVSHDPEFIAWADEIILLDDGRIISRGTFSEISKSEDLFRLALRSV
jgi:ABC-type histidine transport system ATPase subunit